MRPQAAPRAVGPPEIRFRIAIGGAFVAGVAGGALGAVLAGLFVFKLLGIL